MHYCPSALWEVFKRFRGCFTSPGFFHFAHLILGWILLRGAHTVSRVVQVGRTLGRTVHHASVYRFLSAGRWSLDALGRVLVGLLRPWLREEVLAIVDDTLCEKSGRQLFGVGIHYDATRSTYARTGRRIHVFVSGHCWVALAVYVRCPWDQERGWAVPVLWRLYRTPGRCTTREYRKRTELAVELIGILATWLDDRRLTITGDAAYCSKSVLRGLPEGVHFVGPLPLNAALYDLVGRPSPRGRPRRKGYRIASPKTRFGQRRGFETHQVRMYGRVVPVQLFSTLCLWYPSAGTRPVRIVVTRDRRSPQTGRAYVSTDPNLSPQDVLATYARRWQLEVSFRDIKQELGFEDPRNGSWHRLPGRRDDPCRPPTRPADHRGRKAVERTAPLAGVAYALTVCWYLNHGTPAHDVAQALLRAPWHRHKTHVSFADMLEALRSKITAESFRRMCLPKRLRQNLEELWRLAAIAA